MNKCAHFRDVILADYIDGQMEEGPARDVENHLLECAQCRAFLKEVRDNAALPFHRALCQAPPQLWEAVKKNIEEQNLRPSPLEGFLAQWEKWLQFPRLVPVLASCALMLLAGSAGFYTMQIERAKDRDQGEYLASLLGSANPEQTQENDLGTPMEKYFL
jgi:predicted anti-sigma-YlaC factor YlaD